MICHTTTNNIINTTVLVNTYTRKKWAKILAILTQNLFLQKNYGYICFQEKNSQYFKMTIAKRDKKIDPIPLTHFQCVSGGGGAVASEPCVTQRGASKSRRRASGNRAGSGLTTAGSGFFWAGGLI
jgi:hypothetical protein